MSIDGKHQAVEAMDARVVQTSKINVKEFSMGIWDVSNLVSLYGWVNLALRQVGKIRLEGGNGYFERCS